MVRMRSSVRFRLKAPQYKRLPTGGLLYCGISSGSQINASNHGCARAEEKKEVAESSIPRSRRDEARSERRFVSTGEPGMRRRQAKTIRPLLASMVRMRSVRFRLKAPQYKRLPTGGLLYCEISSGSQINASNHGCARAEEKKEVAESSIPRSRRDEARSERYHGCA